MNLFKMLDFQRIHFSRKKALETCHLFAQPNCKNKSLESDQQISSQCPIRKFLTVITNFLRALSQKKDDFSGNNKSRFKNIFVSSAKEALILKTKGILNKLCLRPKHLHHGIPTRGHLHHGIPTRR